MATAKARQRTGQTAAASAEEAVAQAIAQPGSSFAIVAGGTDRFGGEAMSLAVVQRMLQPGAIEREMSSLVILLAQVDLTGEARRVLDKTVRDAMRVDISEGMDLVLPLAVAGIALDADWLLGLPKPMRQLLANAACPLAEQMEQLLAAHGGQRLTTVEQTRRSLLGT